MEWGKLERKQWKGGTKRWLQGFFLFIALEEWWCQKWKYQNEYSIIGERQWVVFEQVTRSLYGLWSVSIWKWHYGLFFDSPNGPESDLWLFSSSADTAHQAGKSGSREGTKGGRRLGEVPQVLYRVSGCRKGLRAEKEVNESSNKTSMLVRI